MREELHTKIKTGYGVPCAGPGYRPEDDGLVGAVNDIDPTIAIEILKEKAVEWDEGFLSGIGTSIGKRLAEIHVGGVDTRGELGDQAFGLIDIIAQQDDPWGYMEEAMGITGDAVDIVVGAAADYINGYESEKKI